MATGELSVAIRGRDDVSPALTAAAQKTEALKRSMEGAAVEADVMRDRFRTLKMQYDLGAISGAKYASQLRTLRADMAGLAAQARLGAESQMLLAQTSRQAETEARRLSGGMTRAAFGVQTLALSMQGGRVSAQGLSSALLTLGIGSPAFLAITAGLAAIGTLIAQIGGNADDADQRLSAIGNRFRGQMGELTDRQLRDIVSRYGPLRLPGGLDLPRAISPEEALQLAAAREEMERRRRQAGRERERERAPRPLALPDRSHALQPADLVRQMRRDISEAAIAPRNLPFPVVGDLPNDFGKLADQIGRVVDAAKDARDPLLNMSNALSVGFGAAIDAVASGGNVFEAFSRGILKALASEARAKAVFELAEGFAALFGKGGPPAAAAHFKAAALYGVAAGVSGALAGGGASAAASVGGGVSRGGDRGSVGRSDSGIVFIVQLVGQTTGEVTQEIVRNITREENLGGRAIGATRAVTVPIDGVVVRR